jgi:hypothetical protein
LPCFGKIPIFGIFTEKFDAEKYKKLSDHTKELEKNLTELKRIRDALGGHVLPQAVAKALETMDLDETGKFEIGQKIKDTHLGFAGNICAAMLLQDVPENDRDTYLIKVTKLNEATLEIISEVLTAYLERKGLLNPV